MTSVEGNMIELAGRAKAGFRLVRWFLVALGLAALLMFWTAMADGNLSASAQVPPTLTTATAMPRMAQEECPDNAIMNGDFEQGSAGWYTFTTGTGWKKNPLIVYRPQFCKGDYCALFGSEGVWETITQTVTIPAQGVLTYWWHMWTTEPEPWPYDRFAVALLTREGTIVAHLAGHDAQDEERVWHYDVVDVSAYAGQLLVLRFSVYNDNYYATSFLADDICLNGLGPPPGPEPPPVVPESSTLILLGLGVIGLMTCVVLQFLARHRTRTGDG